MIPGVIEHLSDQPSALADVFVHYGTGHHLGKDRGGGSGDWRANRTMGVGAEPLHTLRKLQSSWLATALAKRVFPVPGHTRD